MATSDLLLHVRRAFPLSWRMVRACRLPLGRFGEPFFISFIPGGGLYGERWDRFDESGVLFKGAYNPVSIAQYGLYCYERLSEGVAGAREAFLAQARYLRDAQQSDGGYPYPFAHASYDVPAGWMSGLAQGEAFAVFMRAYALTQDAEYLDRARMALAPFEREPRAGGVTSIDGDDVFFEEMAARPTHILNGHIVAAFSVWEAIRYGLASKTLAELHAASVETLAKWLPLYDDDGWSFYELAVQGDRKRRYVPINYHQLHVLVLQVYAAMTQRDEFAAMSVKWRRGLQRWDVRARVWRDSLAWIGETASRRLRRPSSGTWRSLLTNGPLPLYPAEARVERSG